MPGLEATSAPLATAPLRAIQPASTPVPSPSAGAGTARLSARTVPVDSQPLGGSASPSEPSAPGHLPVGDPGAVGPASTGFVATAWLAALTSSLVALIAPRLRPWSPASRRPGADVSAIEQPG
jgi:hypothetical protein